MSTSGANSGHRSTGQPDQRARNAYRTRPEVLESRNFNQVRSPSNAAHRAADPLSQVPRRRSTVDAAAIVMASAMAVLTVVALARMTLLGDHSGSSPAVIVSENIAITATVIGVVVSILGTYRK